METSKFARDAVRELELRNSYRRNRAAERIQSAIGAATAEITAQLSASQDRERGLREALDRLSDAVGCLCIDYGTRPGDLTEFNEANHAAKAALAGVKA